MGRTSVQWNKKYSESKYLQDALQEKTVKTQVMTVTQTLVDGKVVATNTETKQL